MDIRWETSEKAQRSVERRPHHNYNTHTATRTRTEESSKEDESREEPIRLSKEKTDGSELRGGSGAAGDGKSLDFN